MMQTIDLRGTVLSAAELRDRMPRASIDLSAASAAATQLVEAVRTGGEAALRAQADRFDGGAPASLRVDAAEIAAAVTALQPEIREALEAAIARVRAASRAQIPTASVTTFGDGAVVEQRWQPVGRAGLYVPGGKAVYPSSVVMNVVAAQEAGVGSIAVASPPQRAFDGQVHPVVLGALGLLGVTEVYAIGGAGAIAALAYGVPELGLEPVDVITGPGNPYVAAAKQLVQGTVGIDAVAGATEVLVIADASANAGWVAADLISQAEHDEQAGAVLVTDSETLAETVRAEIAARLPKTDNHERATIALSGPQSAVVLVDDLAAAARVSDAYAPEHLELHVADTETLLAQISNAGAVFVGAYAPVSLGDYLAGSNHVLPTGGQARFSSGLGAYSFLRAQQIIRYDEPGLRDVADRIVALSRAEALPAHGEAVQARFEQH